VMYRRVYNSSDGDAQTHSNSIVGHVLRIQSDVLAKLTVTAVCVNGKIEFKHLSARCLEALFGDANVNFLQPIKKHRICLHPNTVIYAYVGLELGFSFSGEKLDSERFRQN
jgi:hypothetical protein